MENSNSFKSKLKITVWIQQNETWLKSEEVSYSAAAALASKALDMDIKHQKMNTLAKELREAGLITWDNARSSRCETCNCEEKVKTLARILAKVIADLYPGAVQSDELRQLID